MNEDKYFYKTIEVTAQAEYKEKGSRFLAYSYPLHSVEDFKKHLATIKKEHSKASHHCFAYRIGTDGNIFRSSDAGEPSGTAGKPILGQIDSKGLTNILIIVVRYFGGTLLGVPGLINAYKSAAAMVLQLAPAIQKPIAVLYTLEFDYSVLNEVMTVIKQFNCEIYQQEQSLFCKFTIGVAKNRLTETLRRLKDIQNLQIEGEPVS